ncbi:MAG TPA: AAA family ATPase, partial [Clostridia bacterium]|nr:AAA family ATPase [Clostridia bacterium]
GHTVQSRPALQQDLAQKLQVDEESLGQAIQALLDEGLLVQPAQLAASWQKGGSPFDKLPAPGQAPSGKWATAVKALVQDSLLHQGEPQLLDQDPDLVSLVDVARIEWALAQRVKTLFQAPKKEGRFLDMREAAEQIDKIARAEAFKPGEEQYQALMMALTQAFSVLTGGPGTGKTSIVRLLTQILARKGEKVLLAAPTGRAARRLSEVCGMPAQTLHRLLALQVQEDRVPDAAFWLSAEPLECDTLIVDECSMIDLFLFSHLLSAVKPGTRLLLIGDADQLPSIGPGQVLRDMLLSGTTPRVRLTQIFRQEAHKLIVSNAHRILGGQSLELDQSLESDFIFIDCPDDQAMHEGVMKLCGRVLPDNYGLDPFHGTQVLSAVRRGRAGVNQLNQSLQLMVQGEDFAGVQSMGRRYAIGDKVMQTRNNYDLVWKMVETGREGQGVMNGETGLVSDVDPKGPSVTVLFEEERLALLQGEDLEDLDLAYATTIHKAQGSEYPRVILVIPPGSPAFLTRNLLYTGVTRARERLFVLTRKSTLRMMLKNNEANERAGMLRFWMDH